MRSVRLGAAVVGLMLAAGHAGLAANAPGEADRLIRHGIELRKLHDDEGAIREFQKAYDLVHTPRAAAQLGLAEQALGRWEDAESHVREAVQADDDPWVVKNRATLGEALGVIEAHVGRVEVIGDPDGAEVSVSGRAAGKLPLAQAVPVSAGEVDVEVTAPGYEPAHRTVTIVAGQYQRVVVRLAKEAAASPGHVDEPAAPVTAPAPSPPPVAPAATPPEPGADGPSTARIVVKWSAAGLSLASLAAGVTFTIVEGRNVSAFDSYGYCKNDNGRAVIAGTTMAAPAACQDALSKSLLDTKLAVAGYVGAGVFAATWLILQLTEPSGSPPRAERALASPICAPSPARLGLACAVRF